MSEHLLLEIGMEEIPARFVRDAVEQLELKLTDWLSGARISHGSVKRYATPRRIAVLIREVSDKQPDMEEEVKGPSRKIALDDSGAWSKAALGFARGQGVDPSELFWKELNGADYVYARKSSRGRPTRELLGEALAQIVASMSFPKNMRWARYELRYVRPIRWLAAMYGSEVIPLSLAGVDASNRTRGHRFLGTEVELAEAGQYADKLLEQHVVADYEERKQRIVGQIQQLAETKGWTVPIQEDLLEEVLFLVEYPTVLSGSFDPDFLHIPKEVLITSMREHQRYFPVLDEEGRLLPHFITVRNGNDVSLEQVAKGNEKVLRARLSDARFFYQEDQKLAIADALGKLDSIVYHEELGTVGDKAGRIRTIAGRLAAEAGLGGSDAAIVDRSAEICKFDLVTQMVYEFPELQGVMGEDYARKAGEPEAVAKAVFEHYQPRSASDSAPASLAGALVSMADKIDSITGCFSLGLIPTGSQDPYALRRQAAGIVHILKDRALPVGLGFLAKLALDVHEKAGLLKRGREEIYKDMMDFFSLRMKNTLSDAGIRYDLIDAVMAAGFDNPAATLRRARALAGAVAGNAGFKLVTEAFNRVDNLAQKSEDGAADPALFAEQEEHALFEAWQEIRKSYSLLLEQGEEEQALDCLNRLQPAITVFFDKVMVMAEDRTVRSNRLYLLRGISGDLAQFADFHRIVWA